MHHGSEWQQFMPLAVQAPQENWAMFTHLHGAGGIFIMAERSGHRKWQVILCG